MLPHTEIYSLTYSVSVKGFIVHMAVKEVEVLGDRKGEAVDQKSL